MTEEPIDDIEHRKLAIEERRLDFEIRQYDDLTPSRKAELEKLNEEIADLRRPFFKKPTYLTPAATILVAIIAGSLAFATDLLKSNIVRQIKMNHQLQAEKSRLEATKNALNTQKDALQGRVLKLDESQKRLVTLNTSLLAQNNDLQGNIAVMNNRIGVAKSQINTLGKEKLALTDQMPLERLKAQLIELQRQLPLKSDLNLLDPSIQDILQQAKNGGSNSPALTVIRHAHDEENCPYIVRAVLAWILYKASGSDRAKELLRDDSLKSTIGQIGMYSFRRSNIVEFLGRLLFDPSIYSVDERVSSAKAFYAASSDDPSARIYVSNLLVNKHEVLLKFRDPWIYAVERSAKTLRTNLRSDQPHDSEGPALDLLRLSPELLAVKTMEAFVEQNSPSDISIKIPFGMTSLYECPFATDVPLCSDFVPTINPGTIDGFESAYMLLSANNRPVYKSWLMKNEKIVALMNSADSYKALRTAPDKIFWQVLERRWVNL